MKTTLFILLILTFELGFGQQTDKDSADKPKVTSTRWITENCSDLQNIYRNNKCAENELNKFVNRKINLPEKLKKGKHEVTVNIAVDKNGTITNVKSKSQNNQLNSEFERVIKLFPEKLKLVDQNGIANDHSGFVRFYIIVE
tara:strand:- start:27524 stop:27949 length:426 start_codon:yes stop_codon:yes gene_type:complete